MVLGLIQMLISLLFTYFLFIFLFYVLQVIGKWKVFEKMGEPGWLSLIPFYSTYILYRDCWTTMPFFIFLAATIVAAFLKSNGEDSSMLFNTCSMAAAVVTMLSCIKMSRSFGHGYLYAFGLFFLNPLFMILTGFGDSRYYGNATNM